MKELLLPQWFINITLALYRFTAGAFGKRVPKPHYGNFCGPFWFVFFTYMVPILLPFVLLAVVVRMLFGKKRGEATGNFIVYYAAQLVATRMRLLILGLVVAGAIIALTVLYWEVALYVWAVIGVLVAYIGILAFLGIALHTQWAENIGHRLEAFWEALPKMVRLVLIGIVAIIISPIILIAAVLVGLVIGIMLAYENYCPLVRESS